MCRHRCNVRGMVHVTHTLLDLKTIVKFIMLEVANVESLLAQLVAFRDSWKAIWNEAKLVAPSL